MRQLLGAANIEGSPLFHVVSGNLGYQVEHHLYPDMPSTRYARDRPAREGHLRALRAALQHRPVLQAARAACSARSCGWRSRAASRAPKPGPYRGEDGDYEPAPNGNGHARNGSPGRNGSGPEQSSDGVRVSMPDED